MATLKPKTLTQHQDGFASIVIALVLVLIMSLLSIGFAQLARREQQSALSKQLATQAYYAAESGVNDVVKAIPQIEAGLKTGSLSASEINKKKCLPPNVLGSILAGPSNYDAVNSATGVSYSCVLLDVQPSNLVWTEVPNEAARHSRFTTTAGLDEFTVKWSSTTGKTNYRPISADLSPATDSKWNSPAVIQMSLTKLGASNAFNRDYMIQNNFTAYLYPSTSGGTVTYSTAAADQGKIIGGNCQSDGLCSVKIEGIGGSANEYYLIRLITFYDETNITIDGAKTPGDINVNFVDGQAKIDVTGRARNVLKRMQVRVSLTGGTDSNCQIGCTIDQPEYSLEAQDICKRLATYPTNGANPALTQYIDTSDTPFGSGSDEACNIDRY